MTWTRAVSTLAPTLLSLSWFTPVSATSVPFPLTMTLAASSVVGGRGTTATILLGAAAPAGGAIVTVKNPVGTTVQAGANQVGIIPTQGSTKINVAAGQRQVNFNVLTAGVAASTVATLTAISGTDEAAVALVINPASPQSLTITPATVTGGQSASATIVLDGAAPAGTGVDIPLIVLVDIQQVGLGDGSVPTADPAPVSVPATVHFPPGASSISVPVTTTAAARDQSVTIRASIGAISPTAASQIFTIKAPVVTALTVAPATIVLGNASTGTIVLNGPAPAKGVNVLVSSSIAAATVARAVTIPAGASSVSFPISTAAPTPGIGTTRGGTGGITTALIGATPANHNIPITSITDGTSNTIQVGESKPAFSATLTILPAVVLQSTSVAPSSVIGGDPITLSISAQSGSSALVLGSATSVVAGTATIAVDQPALVQLPSTVTIPSGGGVVTVNGVTTTSTTDATVTIQTTFGGTTASTTLLVKAPVSALASFTARPTTVTGGSNLIVSFKLSSAISSPTVVTLSTDRPDLIQIPASVTVPVTAVPAPLTFKTQPVTVQTTATITAVAGAQRIPLTITLVPTP